MRAIFGGMERPSIGALLRNFDFYFLLMVATVVIRRSGFLFFLGAVIARCWPAVVFLDAFGLVNYFLVDRHIFFSRSLGLLVLVTGGLRRSGVFFGCQ